MQTLADAVLILHLLFVLFVVGGFATIMLGAVMGWGFVRNLWFRMIHLAAIAYVALESLAGLSCPLTTLEQWLRGARPTREGFIQYWVSRLLYYTFPTWVFTAAYVLFALAVALAFWLIPPRHRRPGGR
ncbi:MAG: DUF2784 domain-containing protein [Betaproteobacteria bacterium]|nr:DUF2784 domain-containing protein [Betaproteobacteria bacterium]